jgi:hypothetical protein
MDVEWLIGHVVVDVLRLAADWAFKALTCLVAVIFPKSTKLLNTTSALLAASLAVTQRDFHFSSVFSIQMVS